ncbi:MAG: LysR family transcriptional regulator [Burkholderiaceae bacterium]|nr:LysR family transcriptional regulator [Burkholderiaceae bacterium]MBP6652241.1 LysR family transcriptional regulator [Xylophilus sp.]MBP6618285.1 LysR family transcriptional regulator [Burkholderiaceae bacterium]MBP7421332.1 LysR family transcriptional regulator [Burkholderiaceae bacterium]MBP8151617.1 LysR family transcriptional regulator [Xylophilus sp.]
MDRLTAMQVFVEVAHSGSFSATADKLDMSRAMVTRYVGELEQWLGARLLQRTTRSVTLTDAGENCLRRSQQMLALVQDVEEETQSHDGALRGQLRITCSMSFAYAQMAAAVVDFLQLHPQLKIDLNASEGALNLVEARIDLAIRISAEPDPALIGRVLAPCTSVLVASPAYLAAHGVPQLPADLATHRCLSYANFGKSVWTFSRGDDHARVSVGSYFSANEATALLQGVLAGGGIALQPSYLANPHLQDGSLQVVLPDWKVPDMAIYALYPSRKHLSPAVRALLDFLVERFAQVPWV